MKSKLTNFFKNMKVVLLFTLVLLLSLHSFSQTLPYRQSFDSIAMPQDWTISATAGGPWVIGNYNYNIPGWAARQYDHTGNNGYYTWMDFTGTNTSVLLISPTINTGSATNIVLDFYEYARQYPNETPNWLYIEAYNGSNWVAVDTIQQDEYQWELHSINLTAFVYNTNSLKIRFRAEDAGSSIGYGDILIDDISIYTPPIMVYSDLQQTQNNLNPAIKGKKNEILSFNIETVGAANAFNVSNLYFNTSGTTNLGDIDSAKVFYTGNTNQFNTSLLYTSLTAISSNISFSGSQSLINGDNYFWLVYYIDGNAIDGNFVDAGLDSAKISSTTYIPTQGNPIGNREIATPYNGTYTIGDDANDEFSSLQDAATKLHLLGVTGSVLLNIDAGIYEENIIINSIEGSSVINTITFKGKGANTKIYPLGNNSTIINVNSKYIILDSLTIINDSISNGFTGIRVTNDSNKVVNCVIDCDTNLFYGTGIYVYGSNDILIKNNTISGGRTGIIVSGNYNQKSTGISVKNNNLINQYTDGIKFTYIDGSIIKGNIITNNRSYNNNRGAGIYCYYGINKLIIENNKVSWRRGNAALYLYNHNYNQANNDSALIINNFLINTGRNGVGVTGLYTYRSRNINIFNNSISIYGASTSWSSSTIYLGSYTNSVSIKNNIFANYQGTGSAIRNYVPIAELNNDYNILFSSSNKLWNNNQYTQPDLAGWKSYTSEAAHSKNIQPAFNSNIDLHSPAMTNNYGTPLVEVSHDIDGDPRSLTAPDIGADESVLYNNNIGVLEWVIPQTGVNLSPTVTIKVKIKNWGAISQSNIPIKYSIDGGQTIVSETIAGPISSQAVYTYTFSTKADFSNMGTYNCLAYSALASDQFHTNDTVFKELYACSSLSGAYTLGYNSSNSFQSFSELQYSLSTCGISGPTIIYVDSGLYNESITFTAVPGASSINTITIKGLGEKTVITRPNNSNNGLQTIKLDGADYFILDSLSIRKDSNISAFIGIQLLNQADNNTITNCIINSGNDNNSYNIGISAGKEIHQWDAYGNNANGTKINNNIFIGGTTAIRFLGTSSTVLCSNNQFNNNTLINQRSNGIYTYYLSNTQIIGNTINNENISSGASNGILCYYGKNTLVIKRNILKWNGYKGIYIYYYNHDSPNSTYALVQNNSVSSSGHGIATAHSKNVKYYYNSVFVRNQSSYALYVYWQSTGIIAKNNIFCNYGHQYYLPVNFSIAQSDYISDYNNIYSTDYDISLANFQSNNKETHSISVDPLFASETDLHAYSIAMDNKGNPISGISQDIDGESRSASTPDIGADEYTAAANNMAVVEWVLPQNGVQLSPTVTIKVKVANLGTLSQTNIPIKYSIDGGASIISETIPGPITSQDTILYTFSTTANFNTYKINNCIAYTDLSTDQYRRNDTIKYEITSCNSLSGAYTLGSNSSNYFKSFNELQNTLSICGVSGPIVVYVDSGYYDEKITFTSILGASSVNTITIKGLGDKTIISSTSTINNNYTLNFDGAKHFIIDSLLIQQDSNTNTFIGIHLMNQADSNIFRNNTINCLLSKSHYNYVNAIVATSYGSSFGGSGNNANYCTFINNTINGGYTGISLNGYFSSGNIISNNSFKNQYSYAIYSIQQSGIIISNNSFYSISNTGPTAIRAFYGINAMHINNNKIYYNNGGNGFNIERHNVNSSATDTAYVYNNFIITKGYGISSNSKMIRYYYNTIKRTENYYQNYWYPTFTLSSYTSDVIIKNNIISNYTGGYAIQASTANTNYISDNNALYTNGTYLCYQNGYIADLQAWQTASNGAANSVVAEPSFLSETNLHTFSIAMSNLGTALSEVSHDIDGELRNTSTPDIGADEYNTQANDVSIVEIISNTDQICGAMPDSVYVVVRNYGTSAQTAVPISLVANTPTGDITISATLPSIASLVTDTIHIGNIVATLGGQYNYKAFTSLSTDTINANDSAYHAFSINMPIAIDYIDNFEAYTTDWNTNNMSINYSHGKSGKGLSCNFNSNNTTAIANKITRIGTVESNSTLVFDYQILDYMGNYATNLGADSFYFLVSDGCSSDYDTVYTVSSSNHSPTTAWSNKQISLSGFAGKNLTIAFAGKWNSGDYYFNIDNYGIASSPEVDIRDTAACIGETITLYADSGNYNYSWRSISNTIEIATAQQYGLSNTDTIIVTVTDKTNNLFVSDTAIVTFNPYPTASASLVSTPYYNFPASLNGSANGGIGSYKYVWSPASLINGNINTQNINTYGITSQHNYTLTVTDSTEFTSCMDTAIISVSFVGGSIAVNPSTTNNSICISNSTNISSNSSNGGPNHTYSWTSNPIGFSSTTENITASPTVDTWYIIEVTDGPNLITDSIMITVNAIPTVSYTGLASAYCVDAATATLSPNQTGGIFSGTGISGNSFSPSTATAGSYNIVYTYTDGNGCTDSATNSTIVNALPTVSYTGLASAYCVDAATATLSPNQTGGTFSGTGISGSTFSPSTATAGSYNIVYTYTDGNGCTDSATNSTIVNALPTVSYTGLASAYCVDAATATLSPNQTGGTFSGTGISGSAFSPSTATAGSFNIVYTYTDGNGCTDSATNSTIVNSLPIVNTGSLTDVCIDAQSFALYGATPIGGAWTGSGVNNNNFNASIAGTGTIYLTYTYTDANNCSAQDSSTQSINGLPILSVIGLDAAYCNNENSDTLISSPMGGIFYGSGIIDSILDPSLANIGSVNIQYNYTDTNGCSDSIILNTLIHSSPQVNIGIDTTICANNSLLINAGTFDNYLWNTGDTTSAINVDSTALGIGTFNYSVIITDINSCTATDSIDITYEALPISLLTDTATICGENNSLLLDAGANSLYNYLWSDGSGLSTLSIDTTILGGTMSYVFITLTSPAGCAESDSSYVYFREIPTINIGNDTTICWTQNLNIDAGTGYSSYLWSTGAISQTINVDSFDFVIGNNTYFVEVFNAANCSNSDTISLSIDQCLGVSNYEKSSIGVTIYPNPNKGMFNIEITTQENQNILLDIFNSQGKLILTDKFNTFGKYQHKVDLQMLAKGIYYIRLLSDNQIVYYGKVIVN